MTVNLYFCDNETVAFVFNIPTNPFPQTFTLYHIHTFPIVNSTNNISMEYTIPKQYYGKGDSFHFNVQDLNACIHFNSYYVCKQEHINIAPNKGEGYICAQALYEDNIPMIKTECTIEIKHHEDGKFMNLKSIDIKPNIIGFFISTLKTQTIIHSCKNNKISSVKKIIGNVVLTVKYNYDCQIMTEEGLILHQRFIETSTNASKADILIYSPLPNSSHFVPLYDRLADNQLEFIKEKNTIIGTINKLPIPAPIDPSTFGLFYPDYDLPTTNWILTVLLGITSLLIFVVIAQGYFIFQLNVNLQALQIQYDRLALRI